jgi:hypothetical protein
VALGDCGLPETLCVERRGGVAVVEVDRGWGGRDVQEVDGATPAAENDDDVAVAVVVVAVVVAVVIVVAGVGNGGRGAFGRAEKTERDDTCCDSNRSTSLAGGKSSSAAWPRRRPIPVMVEGGSLHRIAHSR